MINRLVNYIIARSAEMFRPTVDDIALAYSYFTRHHRHMDFYIENESTHITSEMLEEAREKAEEEFNNWILGLLILRQAIPRENIRISENETREQLYALHVYTEPSRLIRERIENIPTNFLIFILSMAEYNFEGRTQPNEFDVDDVCIRYMDGKLTITCYYNGHRTYRGIIGYH